MEPLPTPVRSVFLSLKIVPEVVILFQVLPTLRFKCSKIILSKESEVTKVTPVTCGRRNWEDELRLRGVGRELESGLFQQCSAVISRSTVVLSRHST